MSKRGEEGDNKIVLFADARIYQQQQKQQKCWIQNNIFSLDMCVSRGRWLEIYFYFIFIFIFV